MQFCEQVRKVMYLGPVEYSSSNCLTGGSPGCSAASPTLTTRTAPVLYIAIAPPVGDDADWGLAIQAAVRSVLLSTSLGVLLGSSTTVRASHASHASSSFIPRA